MKNADSTAMPVLTYEDYQCSEGLPAGYSVTKQRVVNHGGLTKREMFAMHAMQGFLAKGGTVHSIPKMSVAIADALLAELDKYES